MAAAMCLAFAAGGVHVLLDVVGSGSPPSSEGCDNAHLGAVFATIAPVLAVLTLTGARVAKPDAIALALATPILLM